MPFHTHNPNFNTLFHGLLMCFGTHEHGLLMCFGTHEHEREPANSAKKERLTWIQMEPKHYCTAMLVSESGHHSTACMSSAFWRESPSASTFVETMGGTQGENCMAVQAPTKSDVLLLWPASTPRAPPSCLHRAPTGRNHHPADTPSCALWSPSTSDVKKGQQAYRCL